MAKVLDIDVNTGEATEREMTADELADYEKRQNETSTDQE